MARVVWVKLCQRVAQYIHPTRIKTRCFCAKDSSTPRSSFKRLCSLCLSSFLLSTIIVLLRHTEKTAFFSGNYVTDLGAKGKYKAMLGQFHPKNIEGFRCFQAPLTQQRCPKHTWIFSNPRQVHTSCIWRVTLRWHTPLSTDAGNSGTSFGWF